jgi:hypothetical protein
LKKDDRTKEILRDLADSFLKLGTLGDNQGLEIENLELDVDGVMHRFSASIQSPVVTVSSMGWKPSTDGIDVPDKEFSRKINLGMRMNFYLREVVGDILESFTDLKIPTGLSIGVDGKAAFMYGNLQAEKMLSNWNAEDLQNYLLRLKNAVDKHMNSAKLSDK